MAFDYVGLQAELLAGHPDTGAYNANDQLAADELNAVNRPVDVTIDIILKFLLLDNVHSTDGTDTQDRAIWTRMKDVVALAVTPTAAVANPWGSSSLGTITEIQQVKTHQLLNFFTLTAQGDLPVNLTDTKFRVYVAGAQAAGCMSEAQETALNGLGDNMISRGAELSLGRNHISHSHVETARAL